MSNYPTNPVVITPDNFENYINGPMQSVLSLLSLNMSSHSQKVKEMAARALNWSCYAALQHEWARIDHIKNKVWVERCSVQSGRVTMKAKNIQFIHEPQRNMMIGVALRHGEEGREFHYSETLEDCNKLCALRLPKGLKFSEGTLVNVAENDSSYAGYFIYSLEFTSSEIGSGIVVFARSETAIEVTVATHEGKIFSSLALTFRTRETVAGDCDRVDLTVSEPIYVGSQGTYYCWKKPDGYRDSAYLTDLPTDEEEGLSSYRFDSRDEAVAATTDDNYPFFDEVKELAVQGAVLVKVTHQIVPSPY